MIIRKTKIVCTIGPASESREALRKLILAGMDVARLNFSHGTHEAHKKVVSTIRSLSKKLEKPVAILQDLQGPRIRTGRFEVDSVELKAREEWIVTPRKVLGKKGVIPVGYAGLARELGRGHRILLADGAMELEVLSKNGADLLCRVVTGGTLGAHKGVNLPGINTRLPSLTKKDREDLDFGIDMGVDYVALSFVRNRKDVLTLKKIITNRKANIPVICKIEKPQALDEIESILDASEGVMVARGDLGVELLPEKVPLAQKRIIALANERKKLVITATQMLESMTENPRPTRAEVSDVANAILDGTDAVMLSGETSIGRYPVGSVKMMDRIARETESNTSSGAAWEPTRIHPSSGISDAVCLAACEAAESLGMKAIVAFTKSGYTAGLVSKRRPSMPIIAFTPYPVVQRRLILYWGVTPRVLPFKDHTDALVEAMETELLKARLAKKGDRVALLGGAPVMAGSNTNMLKLHVIGDR